MRSHRFRVGQVVDARKDPGGDRPTGPYEVVRLMPPTVAGTYQYQVKSLQNGHQRVVLENDLFVEGA